jgi:hypothetical protein
MLVSGKSGLQVRPCVNTIQYGIHYLESLGPKAFQIFWILGPLAKKN